MRRETVCEVEDDAGGCGGIQGLARSAVDALGCFSLRECNEMA